MIFHRISHEILKSCQKHFAYASIKEWQEPWKVDNWEGGHIHIFMFTERKNNRFQKKLIIMWNMHEYMNIAPPPPQ